MVINALYKKYFQKSKIFVYPLLDIRRGTQIVPSETYLSWNDVHNPEDKKLVCVYETDEETYAEFEKNILLKHTRLCSYNKINAQQSVFVFDFSDLGSDWNHLLYGRYSKISLELKRKIVNFFDKSSGNYVYVTSYMFPDKFFSRYAEILDIPVDILINVGELCDKPDLEKEKLLIEIANFENIKDSRVSL